MGGRNMDLSQLIDDDIEKAIEIRDVFLTGVWSVGKYIFLYETVDLYEEQLRRWSEKRKGFLNG
jgi:hypothetical protein